METETDEPDTEVRPSDVDEAPERPDDNPDASESGKEEEVIPEAESAENVQELMDQWSRDYASETTPQARRAECAFLMMKMEQALQTASLRANEVKIAALEKGVLGFYIPSTNEIYITPQGLGDPVYYAEILYHEKTHKEGIADEGATQLKTRQDVPNARRAIYEAEQLKVERHFDVPDLLDRYDIEDPDEFVDFFLEQEVKEKWEGEWKAKLGEEALPASDTARHRLYEKLFGEEIAKMDTIFKEALPRMHDEVTKSSEHAYEEKIIELLDGFVHEDESGKMQKSKGKTGSTLPFTF